MAGNRRSTRNMTSGVGEVAFSTKSFRQECHHLSLGRSRRAPFLGLRSRGFVHQCKVGGVDQEVETDLHLGWRATSNSLQSGGLGNSVGQEGLEQYGVCGRPKTSGY